MCVGLLPAEKLTSAKATGPGNLVVLYGSKTGRDGIGGASRAGLAGVRRELGGQAAQRPDRRPVHGQEADRVHARPARPQPAGLAAGSGRGRAGLVAQRDGGQRRRRASTSTCRAVPLREEDMQPFEIMISESQERMAAVVEPARLDDVLGGLRALGPGRHRDRRGHRQRAAAGVRPTATRSARCRSTRWSTARRATRSRRSGRRGWRTSPGGSPSRRTRRRRCARCWGRPTAAAGAGSTRQYDQLVGSGTVVRPGGDASVVRLTPSNARDRDLPGRQRPPDVARSRGAAA